MLDFLFTITCIVLYAIFDKDVYLISAGLFAIASSIGIVFGNISTTFRKLVERDKKNQN